jgi:hypothetical protein
LRSTSGMRKDETKSLINCSGLFFLFSTLSKNSLMFFTLSFASW